MGHDFMDDDKTKCRSTTTQKCCHGFMHYGIHPNVWSDCSVRDFQTLYRERNWGDTCMEGSFNYIIQYVLFVRNTLF